MRFEKISPKQLEIFKFAHEPYTALICDGAVRSGKTIMMAAAFLEWAMHGFSGAAFALCGKTVRSAERNLVQPLLALGSLARKYRLRYSRSLALLTGEYQGRTNSFYVFGGRDESSYMLIQGMTLAGALLDETALMPRSFVEQTVTRTLSVDSAKLWFNCNPASPAHWFYREWICRAGERNAKRLHFLMEDNPGLSPRAIERARASFSGVFYDRYILGKWAAAEGLVYPRAAEGEGVVPSLPREYTRFCASVDYGTLNPCSMGLWGYCGGVWYRFAEYYHSGRDTHVQLTDEEYCDRLEQLAAGRPLEAVVVDPSASSFIAALRRRGRYPVRPADNSVLAGIRDTAAALREGRIAVCDCCQGALREFALYQWDAGSQEDRPVKENDHAMDEIRYFVRTILRGEVFSFA
ncbi:MAG TPA: PBSX family phage terminase large subunit [Candidatus Caccousia avistercoris]|nr:PBSX family phage terminase large subunit [Candidatus Caccousia avistercoris]